MAEFTDLSPREFAASRKAEAVPVYEGKGIALNYTNNIYTLSDATVEGSAVVVDGDLSEWGELRYEVNRCAEATTPNNFCRFDTKWTDKYLSIAVDVTDSHIVTSFISDDIFQNDSIEIFIDGLNEKGSGYTKNTYHIFIQFDGRILIQRGPGEGGRDSTIDGFLYATKLTNSGFSVEMNIPFVALGIEKPSEGTVIGLEVCNNDNDNDLKSDRQELTWNASNHYAQPATWGSLYLYNEKSALAASAGTPALDGTIDLSAWDLSNTIYVKDYDEAKASFGLLCDSRMLYLGVKIDDPKGSFANVIKDAEGEYPPLVQVIIDGDNHAKGAKNQYDWIFNWQPTLNNLTFWNGTPDFETAYVDHNTVGIIAKQIKLDRGYFLVCAFPWERLTPTADGYAQRNNYTQLGFDIMAGSSHSMNPWYKEAWAEVWRDKAVNGLGRVYINNPKVAAHVNTPPMGREIYSYSIVQGSSISGKINVYDIDGDKITYSLIGELPESEGSVTLNAETGEWCYTTPNADFVKPDYIKRDPLNRNRTADPVGVNFFIKSEDGNGGEFKTRIEIRVCYKPTYLTYYVNGDIGCDNNDGLSEEKPLKTITAAHDKSRPGDTIIIHESKIPYCYNRDENFMHDGPFILTNSGLPEAWITYKAADGENPVLKSCGEWNVIMLQGYYIVLDGLTVEARADEIDYDYAWNIYYEKLAGIRDTAGHDVSITQTNGITIEPIGPHTSHAHKAEGGVYCPSVIVPNHIIVRNCTANMLPGCGIGIRFCDHVTIENCTSINNGWWSIYATSGYSTLGNIDIDDDTGYKIIFRNCIAAGNRHFLPWLQLKRLSDGNGFILDTTTGYQGKILVMNNLSYENGGSGIHAFRSDHVDIINNTILYNNATPGLKYSDLYANTADHVNMFNNIVYSRPDNKESPFDSRNVGCAYDNNIFYNYNEDSKIGISYKGTVVGEGNMYQVDPKFTELVPVVHDYKNCEYPADWPEDKIENAKKSAFVPGDDYDIRHSGIYNVFLQDDSPAWAAGNKHWSEFAGNTDNRIGAFGNIGAHGKLQFPPKAD